MVPVKKQGKTMLRSVRRFRYRCYVYDIVERIVMRWL